MACWCRLKLAGGDNSKELNQHLSNDTECVYALVYRQVGPQLQHGGLQDNKMLLQTLVDYVYELTSNLKNLLVEGITNPFGIRDLIKDARSLTYLIGITCAVVLSAKLFHLCKDYLFPALFYILKLPKQLYNLIMTNGLKEGITAPKLQSGWTDLMDINDLQRVASLLFTGLCFVTMPVLPKGKKIDEFLRRIDLTNKAFTAAPKLIDQLKILFDRVVLAFRKHFLGHHIRADIAIVEEVNDWARKVQEKITMPTRAKGLHSTQFIEEVTDLFMQAYKWKSGKDWKDMPAETQRVVLAVYPAINDLYKEVCKTTAHEGGPRCAPLCIVFEGSAGVGKSELTVPLAYTLLRARKVKGSLKDRIYTRNAETEFWDGYEGQNIVIADDAFQMVDSVAKPCVDYMELVRINNTSPYMLHMAHLNSKGMYFTSDVYLATTNMCIQNMHTMIKSLNCKEAVTRRVAELAFKVGLKREYATNGRVDSVKVATCAKCAIKKNEIDDCLPFCKHLYEFRIYNTDGSGLTGQVFNWDEMVRFVCFHDANKFVRETQKKEFYTSLEEDMSILNDKRTCELLERSQEDIKLDHRPTSEDVLDDIQSPIFNFGATEEDSEIINGELESSDEDAIGDEPHEGFKFMQPELQSTDDDLPVEDVERFEEDETYLDTIEYIDESNNRLPWTVRMNRWLNPRAYKQYYDTMTPLEDWAIKLEHKLEQRGALFHLINKIPFAGRILTGTYNSKFERTNFRNLGQVKFLWEFFLCVYPAIIEDPDMFQNLVDANDQYRHFFSQFGPHFWNQRRLGFFNSKRYDIHVARMMHQHLINLDFFDMTLQTPHLEGLARMYLQGAPNVESARALIEAQRNQFAEELNITDTLDFQDIMKVYDKYGLTEEDITQTFTYFTKWSNSFTPSTAKGYTKRVALAAIAAHRIYMQTLRVLWQTPVMIKNSFTEFFRGKFDSGMGYVVAWTGALQYSILYVASIAMVGLTAYRIYQLTKDYLVKPTINCVKNVCTTTVNTIKTRVMSGKVGESSSLENKSSSGPLLAPRKQTKLEGKSSSGPLLQPRKITKLESKSSSGPLLQPRKNVKLENKSSSGPILQPRKQVKLENADVATLMPGYMKQDVVQDIELEGNSDINAMELIKHKLANNTYLVKCNIINNPLGSAIFVSGTTFVMPHHFYSIVRHAIIKYDFDSDDVNYTLSNPKTGTVVKFQFNDIVDNTVDYERDIILVTLNHKSSIVHPHSNIISSFITESDINLLAESHGSGILYTIREDSTLQNAMIDLILQEPTVPWIISDSMTDVTYKHNKFWFYYVQSEKGDCGGPLIIFDKTFHRKILGMHVAGGGVVGKAKFNMGYGMSVPITQEWIKNRLPEFQIHGPDVSEIGDTRSVAAQLQGFVPIAQVPKTQAVSSSGRTKVIESILHNEVFPATCKPAHLRAFRDNNGIRHDPMLNGLKKFVTDRTLIPTQAIIDTVNSYKKDILYPKGISPRKLYQRKLTVEEAIMGTSEFGKINIVPLDRNTSAGYPWNKMNLHGKREMFGKDEWDLDNELARDVIKTVEELRTLCLNGSMEGVVWVDTLKDERRPIEKVEAGKTRLFPAGTVHLTILHRQYFWLFQQWIIDHRIQNGIAVGINVFGEEWGDLHRHLTSFGELDNIMAGDFSNYDGTLNPQVMWAIFDIIEEWCALAKDVFTPDDIKIMKTLWAHCIHAVHINDDYVYQSTAGLPSGSPITAIINSLYNNVIMRLASKMIIESYILQATKNPDHYDLKFDFDNIEPNTLKLISRFSNDLSGLAHLTMKMVAYGDDNVIAIHNRFIKILTPDNFTSVLKKLGHEYTDEAKTGTQQDLKSITDIAFLKRKFKFEKELNRFVAPLDLTVIKEMIQWTKSGPLAHSITLTNVNTAYTELALHGSEIFDRHAIMIHQKCVELELQVILNTRDYYLGAMGRSMVTKEVHLQNSHNYLGFCKINNNSNCEIIPVEEEDVKEFKVTVQENRLDYSDDDYSMLMLYYLISNDIKYVTLHFALPTYRIFKPSNLLFKYIIKNKCQIVKNIDSVN